MSSSLSLKAASHACWNNGSFRMWADPTKNCIILTTVNIYRRGTHTEIFLTLAKTVLVDIYAHIDIVTSLKVITPFLLTSINRKICHKEKSLKSSMTGTEQQFNKKIFLMFSVIHPAALTSNVKETTFRFIL